MRWILASFIPVAMYLLAASAYADTTEAPRFDEEYYSRFTYDWVDEKGVSHTSKLTEPATEYPQIVALLWEVYRNPQVPGFVRDKAWDDSRDDAEQPNEVYNVPYGPCLAENNPYGSDANTVVETPVEGATVLLVELVDDYVYDKDDSCEDMLRKIKQVTLLPHQRYVDSSVSTTNPGYLFNYVGTLNRFFVISKGSNRLALNSENEEGKYVGHAPFYQMYEELSPSNSGVIYDAFADMNAGHGFAVDHNCTSIMGQNHIVVMSPDPSGENFSQEDFRDYAVNFMFFLPDLRFDCDSRKSPNSDYKGAWYTYYDLNHSPYFFFNKIVADIKEAPQNVDKDTARVKVEWESTYNRIVGYEANEDFYVYRVVNDVIQETPLGPEEYEIIQGENIHEGDDDYIVKNPDGSMTSRVESNAIWVSEPRGRFAYDVNYIVTGRRYLTDFEFTESNIVTTTIPGYVEPETPPALNIVIDGNHKSKHDLAISTNNYTHTIYLLDSKKSDEVTLAKRHLRATDEEGVATGTRFLLKRYSADPEDATTVATLEITGYEYDTRWNNQHLFTYEIKDADGNPIEIESNRKPLFKAPEVEGVEADNLLITAPDDCDNILAVFHDNFSVSTAEGNHPDEYHYFIDYQPAVLESEETIDFDALSNTVDFVIPHNLLKVGYIPYSEVEIESDLVYETRIPLNESGIQFSVTSNTNVSTYTIYNLSAGNAPKAVVEVTRLPSGRLSIDRLDGKSNMTYFNSVFKVAEPCVATPYGVNVNDELALVVKYANGNSYGNRLHTLRELPFPNISSVDFTGSENKPNGDNSRYKAKLAWSSQGLDNFDNPDESFLRKGYRAWSIHNAVDQTERYSVYDDVEASDPSDEEEAPAHSPRRNDPDQTDLITKDHEFTAHEATMENPVEYNTTVRLYARLPESMNISESSEPGYIVAERSESNTKTKYREVITGVDNILDNPGDENAPVEYFNLQGMPVAEPLPGSIVIRRQGSTVTKIVVPKN